MRYGGQLAGGGCGMLLLICTVWIAVFVGVTAIVGALMWFLWNQAVVPAFHVTTLTYWQACGITALLSLIANMFRSTSSKSKD